MSVLDARGLAGSLVASATARRTVYERADAAIRVPVATARRIGVVSVTPATPTTALTLALARAIAARRAEPVLVVDVADGEVAAGLGASPTRPEPRRAAARTTADAMTGLMNLNGVVALRPSGTSDDAVGAWLAEAAPIARFFDVSISDFGPRHPLRDLASCAALCDVVCLVAGGDRGAAEEVRAVAPAIAALPEAPTPVLALLGDRREAARVAAAVADDSLWPVVSIPVDPAFTAGRGARRLVTTRAVLQLAAVLVGGGRATP